MSTKKTGLVKLDEEEETGDHFSSKIGLILSCLGCVVGTGNIWRFPRIVAQNSGTGGGLVFMLVWFVFLFLWSIPMLMIEYGTGRYTKKAIIQSFRQFVGDKATWCGAWVSMVTFLISCYYSVVLGWCLYYVMYSIGYGLPNDSAKSREIFRDFAEDSYWPVLTHGIAVTLAGLSVIKGVKTIEKVNMVLVPTLLVIILFTFTWSLTREYADYGIKYLFTPDWENFKEPRVWVDAISQNAFDTGAGMGLMVPYSAYMTRSNGIVRYAVMIPATNNLVSLIGGITIFSTVFSTLILSQPSLSRTQIVDIVKDSGPASTGLTFIWIPVLFSTLGTFGTVLCVLFFICLSFAGVTSLISNMELTAHTFADFGIPRKYGTPLTILLTFLIGLPSALNINFLTNQDFVWGFALIINGLMFQAMVVIYGVKKFRKEVVNKYSTDDWKLPKIWMYQIKFIAPLEAVVLIVWWAIDLIGSETDGETSWYEFGTESFMMTITQWLGLMLLMVMVNVILLLVRPRWFINTQNYAPLDIPSSYPDVPDYGTTNLTKRITPSESKI